MLLLLLLLLLLLKTFLPFLFQLIPGSVFKVKRQEHLSDFVLNVNETIVSLITGMNSWVFFFSFFLFFFLRQYVSYCYINCHAYITVIEEEHCWLGQLCSHVLLTCLKLTLRVFSETALNAHQIQMIFQVEMVILLCSCQTKGYFMEKHLLNMWLR